MNKKRMSIMLFLMFGLLAAGCAQSTAGARQDNETRHVSTHLVFYPDFADRSFKSSEDYMISTGFDGVTYIWPKGKGSFSKDTNEITFEGDNISCSIVERRLTINGNQIAEFEEGDRVRITGEGKVFVNDVEVKQQ